MCEAQEVLFQKSHVQVKFLGDVISDMGIKVDPAKIAIVQDWPTPLNVSDIRRFLGLSND